VLINFLTNAQEAMRQGGAVEITTCQLPDESGWVQLTVADSGTGIAADSLSRIFNLDFTTKSSGSGLGLWLSRRIIQEHHGKIQVQSELGKGTTFTIKLPTVDHSGS
jgi:signal transduction histidine kinase